jgi:hypothetical protein
MRSPLRAPAKRARLPACLLSTLLLACSPGHAAANDVRDRDARAIPGAVADTVRPGSDVLEVADWSARSGDNGGKPFVVVDKRNARVFVFDGRGSPVASAPVLLGAARGDDSVPGIGERRIGDILPHERTTPAGRFVGEAGRNLQGEDIVWVDYDAAVSMHRVRATNPRERRLERLATPTTADNRISYGCINVPADFFDRHLSPMFAQRSTAMIYVLPETRPLRQVFGHAIETSALPSR